MPVDGPIVFAALFSGAPSEDRLDDCRRPYESENRGAMRSQLSRDHASEKPLGRSGLADLHYVARGVGRPHMTMKR